MAEETKTIRVRINEDCFIYNPTDSAQKLGGTLLPVDQFERIEYPEEGGILCYYRVYKFPAKGIPVASALELICVIKKLIINTLKVITSFPFRYLMIPFFFFPRHVRQKAIYYALGKFADVCDWTLNRWYLTPKRLSTPFREIYFKTEEYVNKNFGEPYLTISAIPMSSPALTKKEVWLKMAYIVCMILHYDAGGYGWRAQDILMELNKENLRKDPAKELERLFGILMKRERTGGVDASKYEPFFTFAKWGLKLKRKSWEPIIDILCSLDITGVTWEEFKNADLEKVLPQGKEQRIGRDHADWYHRLNATMYDFGGVSFNERFSLRREIDGKMFEKLRAEGNLK